MRFPSAAGASITDSPDLSVGSVRKEKRSIMVGYDVYDFLNFVFKPTIVI